MIIDDREYQDPTGDEWSDYGRDPRYATGLWAIIPVVLVVFLAAYFFFG